MLGPDLDLTHYRVKVRRHAIICTHYQLMVPPALGPVPISNGIHVPKWIARTVWALLVHNQRY